MLRGYRIWLALLLCLLVSACQDDTEQPIAEEPGFQETFSQGEFAVQVSLSRQEMSVAEQTVLTLIATAPEDSTLEFPAFEAMIGDFSIVRSPPIRQELTSKGLTQIRSFTLAPFLSGNYPIPEMTFIGVQTDVDTPPVQIIIPEIQVMVASLLSSDDHELSNIAPVLDIPKDYFFLWLISGLALIAILAFAFYWTRIRKPLEDPPLPPLPPHVIAGQAMDELLAENLAEQGRSKEFYERISHILRFYIENLFGLKAVEQTTEEFFHDLKISPLFPADQKLLLKKFLDHCDLVKFAEYQPGRDETENTTLFCRKFIQQTSRIQNGLPGQDEQQSAGAR
ncbi:MAG: hypothetical protein J7L69_03090 [Desulfobulbaceae bacterium]|nr:hypothetical protein [Desulfobulbaceae bacterium]